MRQHLNDFITEWNKSHKHLIFFIQTDESKRPLTLEIRFSATRYQDLLQRRDSWYRLCALLEAKSRHTIYVITSDFLFQRGIIEAKIASRNHNFKEGLILSSIRFLAEEFFPQA